jgi:ABC-2 type transport system ATP-binding protein
MPSTTVKRVEVIRIDEMSRCHGRGFMLGPLSFTVNRGEILGLMGPNGAGKTTLLKLIWGFLRPDHGMVRVFGLTPHLEQLVVRLRAGLLSESPQFYGWMRARRFLDFMSGFYDRWDENYLNELAGRFQLDLDKRIEQLSKGNRAKLGLMAAVAHHPELLLLDEPTSGLDPIVRLDILEFLGELASEHGVAILLSSHISDDLDQIAQRVLMLHEGRLVALAPTAVLLREYKLPKLESVFLHAIGKISQNHHRH